MFQTITHTQASFTPHVASMCNCTAIVFCSNRRAKKKKTGKFKFRSHQSSTKKNPPDLHLARSTKPDRHPFVLRRSAMCGVSARCAHDNVQLIDKSQCKWRFPWTGEIFCWLVQPVCDSHWWLSENYGELYRSNTPMAGPIWLDAK